MADMTRQQIIALLSKRDSSRHYDQGIYLGDMNLSGLDLSGLDLHGASIEWSDLSNSNLTDCDLSDTNMIGTHGNNVNLTNVKARNCKTSGTSFKYSVLNGANFQGTHGPTETDHGELKLWACDCTEVNFKGVNCDVLFHLCRGLRSNFEGANLSGSNFDACLLQECSFRGSNLSAASLGYNLSVMSILDGNPIPEWCTQDERNVLAMFKNVLFSGAQYNQKTTWLGIDPAAVGAVRIWE